MIKITQILSSKDIKITPQRLHIYSILIEKPAHLSIDDVYKKVKNSLPTISRATVYSILDLFTQSGLLNSLNIDNERIYYDSRIDTHYHFLCNKCKNIFDIDINVLPKLDKVDCKGHSIDTFQGYFYGICKNCKEKGEKL